LATRLDLGFGGSQRVVWEPQTSNVSKLPCLDCTKLGDNWWLLVAKKSREEDDPMKSEAVSLPVIAGVPLDCSFWLEDDGWSGVCERLSVIVRGGSFENAKKNMEVALQEHLERMLREYLGRRSQRIA
jgi:predicted RNase H-like HicB family nuclease